MFGQKKDIYGNTYPAERRRWPLLIVGGVVILLLVVGLIFSAKKKQTTTLQKAATMNRFSNNQFSIQYPEGFTVSEGDELSPGATFTPSAPDQNNTTQRDEIVVTRLGRVDELKYDSFKSLESSSQNTSIEETTINNRQTLVAHETNQDGETKIQTHRVYIYADVYVWRIAITTPEGSNLAKYTDQIIESFSPKDAELLKL